MSSPVVSRRAGRRSCVDAASRRIWCVLHEMRQADCRVNESAAVCSRLAALAVLGHKRFVQLRPNRRSALSDQA